MTDKELAELGYTRQGYEDYIRVCITVERKRVHEAQLNINQLQLELRESLEREYHT